MDGIDQLDRSREKFSITCQGRNVFPT